MVPAQQNFALQSFLGLHGSREVFPEHDQGAGHVTDLVTAPAILVLDLDRSVSCGQLAHGVGDPGQRKDDSARDGGRKRYGKGQHDRREHADPPDGAHGRFFGLHRLRDQVGCDTVLDRAFSESILRVMASNHCGRIDYRQPKSPPSFR